jgi:glycosyltransferase involved in cell wall biosynthesis
VKVLFAIKKLVSAVGGAERVLCIVCSDLVSRGHEVSILTFDFPGDQPFYPLDQRVKRIDLGIGDSARPAGMIETFIRMRALRRAINAERPDVTVGFMHSMFIPLAFALAGTGVPVLGSEHIVLDHYRTRRLQYMLLILASFFLKNLTVLSQSIRSRYPFSLRRKMVEIPNPVETAVSCANVSHANEIFTLLSVGRLEIQKDHSTLVRAFAKIMHQFPQWHLKIVGEGSLRQDLALLIDKLDMAERVMMPGVMANISEAYLSAQAFVIPSRYEAFGLVTTEAMSYGLPVIGFADCPGTNEIIIDGLNGLLVEPGDDRVNSLAEALSTLLSNPELRQQFGAIGKQSIITYFSPRQVCNKWEELLQKCCKPFPHRVSKNKNDGVN